MGLCSFNQAAARGGTKPATPSEEREGRHTPTLVLNVFTEVSQEAI